MIDPYDKPVFTGGFLLASASVGMRLSDPIVHTYVRLEATAEIVVTIVVTIKLWSPSDEEFVTGQVKVLGRDGIAFQRDVAFEGDRAMPEAPADRTLIAPVPYGTDDPKRTQAMIEAMLAGCREIALAA